MNKILQGVLMGIGKELLGKVPGGNAALSGVQAGIAARKTPEKADDIEAVFQTIVAGIQILEGFGGHFAEEPSFQTHLYMAKAGVTGMIGDVRAHKAATVPTTPAT